MRDLALRVAPIAAQFIGAALQMIVQQRQEQENAAFSQRVNAVKERAFLPAISEAIKGSFLENDIPFVISELGRRFEGRELDLIAALERGDTSSLVREIKGLQKEWRERFNGWGRLIIAERKRMAASVPRTGGEGVSRRGEKTPVGEFDLHTREGRMAFGNAMGPSKQ